MSTGTEISGEHERDSADLGAIYYLVRGRTKAFAPVVAPAGDDPAQSAAGGAGAAAQTDG